MFHCSLVLFNVLKILKLPFSKMAATTVTAPTKPPNIVIFGNGKFEQVQKSLSACLDPERYVFLSLDDRQLVEAPWQDSAELMVFNGTTGEFPELFRITLQNYWKNKGKILFFGADLPKLLDGLGARAAEVPGDGELVRVVHRLHGEGRFPGTGAAILEISSDSYRVEKIAAEKETDVTMIGAIRGDDTDGTIVFSQVPFDDVIDNDECSWKKKVLMEILADFFNLDCSPGPMTSLVVSPCYVHASTPAVMESFLTSWRRHLHNDQLQCPKVLLRLTQDEGAHLGPQPGHPSTPEITLLLNTNLSKTSKKLTFSPQSYYRHLKTRALGHVMWYGEVVTSTMDLLDSSNIPHGVVCIAGRQTGGRGRRGHVWLSPEGCAMFSLMISVPVGSKLGQRISFVQHLAALAIVEGIVNTPGYQDLDLRLKWPNDIYYGHSVKLGGVIVQTTITSDTVCCIPGCGVNVSNSKPTLCLNDVIRLNNPDLPLLDRERVIAQAMNKLEELIDEFQDGGSKVVLPKYYSRWLHGGAEVELTTPNGSGQRATILGLDDYGFLRVRVRDSGRTFSVQPDGNSFDVLRNMLIIREDASN